MSVGLSTYAFFWQHSDVLQDSARAAPPLSLDAMLLRTRELGASVFQICDYPLIEGYRVDQLVALKALADSLDISLELGTRGLLGPHLARYLEIAQALDVTVVRSMVNSSESRPTPQEAETLLRAALPAYEAAGVSLALETYEQVSSGTLVSLVETVASDRLGICLDPANCVAALELPNDVIDRVASYVLNVHAKDFSFTRRDGWVGFTLSGCPMGEGLLDYGYLLERVQPRERGVNEIVEHWLPWQADADATFALENNWTEHNLNYLRSI